jgi:hypothetical protein
MKRKKSKRHRVSYVAYTQLYAKYEELLREKELSDKAVLELTSKLSVLENPHAEFYIKCKLAKLSKRDTEIAFKYFVEHNTPKEIWNWLCSVKEYEAIEWDSLYQLLWRISKKLNNAKDL